jgi:hypothetical protein
MQETVPGKGQKSVPNHTQSVLFVSSLSFSQAELALYRVKVGSNAVTIDIRDIRCSAEPHSDGIYVSVFTIGIEKNRVEHFFGIGSGNVSPVFWRADVVLSDRYPEFARLGLQIEFMGKRRGSEACAN